MIQGRACLCSSCSGRAAVTRQEPALRGSPSAGSPLRSGLLSSFNGHNQPQLCPKAPEAALGQLMGFCLLVENPRQIRSLVPEVVIRHSTSPHGLPVPHKIRKLLTVSHRPLFSLHRLVFVCLAAVSAVLGEAEATNRHPGTKTFGYLEALVQGHVNTELAGM